MIIALIILILLLLWAYTILRIREYKAKKKQMEADQEEFWRKVNEHNITLRDRKDAEMSFKLDAPHMNRHERRKSAVSFLGNMKKQARFETQGA
jgi:predicted Holliday junction resolvase-like endonuclease